MVVQRGNNEVMCQLKIYDTDVMYFDVSINDTTYIIDCIHNSFTLYHKMGYEETASDSDDDYENMMRDMPPPKEWECVISICKIPNTEIHLYENCEVPYFAIKLDNGSVSTRISEQNAQNIYDKIIRIINEEVHHSSLERIEVTDVSLPIENQTRQRNLTFLERWPKFICDVECYQKV